MYTQKVRNTPRPQRIPRAQLAKGFFCLIICLSLLAGQFGQAYAFFGTFTRKDERELGEKLHAVIRAQMPIIEDPVVTGYVQDMINRISQHVPSQPWKFKSTVIMSNQFNAFAAPGGFVYVYSGLILQCKHEADLAGIMSHELAHVTQRHIAKRFEKQRIIGPAAMLATLAGAFLGGNNVGPAVMLGSQAAAQSAMLAYSREDEREADQVGMNYLVASGYNPKGMVRGFEVLKRKQFTSGGPVPTYLSTHPGLLERIGYLSSRILRMPPEYMKRPEDDTHFRKVQTLIRAHFTEADIALRHFDMEDTKMSCLDLMGKGIVLSRLNRVSQAKEYFTKALEYGNNDPLVLREAGRFYFELGEFEQAGPLLQKSLLLDSKDLMTLFFYARLLSETGDHKQAITYMKKIQAKVPDDAEVRQTLGTMYGKSGDLFKAHLELAYAALYRNRKKKIAFHKNEAQRYAKTKQQRALLDTLEKTIADRQKLLEG
jgi:predicted Zn-dependent protease